MPLLLTSFIVHSCPQGEANQRQATDRSATRSVEIYLLYPLVSQHHSSSIVVLETQRKLRGETKKPTGAINIPKPSINVHTPEVAFDDGFKQLQGTVDDFQNVLRTLTADLANVAQMPADTTSGSISQEIAFQGFRLGLDELGTSFPKLVKEMSGLAKAVMRPVEGTRPEEADAGGGHQGRKPAMKTSKKTDSKKCSRAEDDHDAEKDGRHHPRPRLIHPEHQNNTSQEVMSTVGLQVGNVQERRRIRTTIIIIVILNVFERMQQGKAREQTRTRRTVLDPSWPVCRLQSLTTLPLDLGQGMTVILTKLRRTHQY